MVFVQGRFSPQVGSKKEEVSPGLNSAVKSHSGGSAMFDISQIYNTSDFPPRWDCGNWSEAHGWTHIISDAAIFGAYTAIPIVLVYFVLKRRDVPFPRIFWLFGAFIFFCGFGHLVEASIFWI